MSTTAPGRSLEQRMYALQLGNDIRSRRAQTKRDLKIRRITIVALLEESPDYLLTMKVDDLLLATPRWGRVKVTKIVNRCRISPAKTVGGLSARQRQELVALIRSLPR